MKIYRPKGGHSRALPILFTYKDKKNIKRERFNIHNVRVVVFALLSFLYSIYGAQSQVYTTTFIDFGPNDATNGNITKSPDVNGNYWNNLTNPSTTAAPVNLINNKNQATGASVLISTAMSSNGINSGGLLSPSSQLLQQFAIPTATQDYFYTATSGSVTIKGLNASRGYKFSIFATRNDPETRVTTYSLQGTTHFTGTLKTSEVNLGGTGYNGNNSTILVSNIVIPKSTGEIVLSISRTTGSYGYIGVMKIEEVPPAYRTSFIDFGPNDGTNGNITASPDGNGNYWNNATDPTATAAPVNLVDVRNQSTGASLVVTTGLEKNGIQSGGLLAPSSALLNQFAIATATQDFFHTPSTGSIKFRGLNVSRGYIFSIFATRNDPESRITTYSIQGKNVYSGTLKTSGTDLGGTGYHGNNRTILVSSPVVPDSNGEIVFTIARTAGAFAYLGALKLEEVSSVTIEPFCKTKDRYKIAWMGSSVPTGVGATNNQGYVYRYTEQLKTRFSTGKGKNWLVSNISVPGNNTIAVLNRWDKDLLPLCSRYVVYSLSLGNEGIITGGQATFNQFKDNLQLLINKARAEGIEPIITNCYTRNDYTATQYNYIKQMNLLINSWNVTSINLLGALDNGTGQWAPGYFADALHPNDAGHDEFRYSIVPSLFDALDAGKPQPRLVTGTSLAMGGTRNFKLEFIPEETVHPFTLAFDIKTSTQGQICQVENVNGMGNLTIVSGTGALKYNSPSSTGISGTSVVSNGQWHKITLTHYYALGKTFLYVDNVLQGSVSEKIGSRKFGLAGTGTPIADYRNFLFYRSGMNSSEVEALMANKLLKSSLEIYSPLDAQGITGKDTLVNLAQSTNKILKRKLTTSSARLGSVEVNDDEIQLFPNPTAKEINVISTSDIKNILVYDLQGKEKICGNSSSIDISSLPSGNYTIKIIQKNRVTVRKVIKQ